MFGENLSIETRDMIDKFTDVYSDALLEEAIEEQHNESVILQDIQDDINTSDMILVMEQK